VADGLLQSSNAADTTGTEHLNLEVQVGCFSRVEDLSLYPGWQLSFGDDRPS
jgi:hypothetical protein